MRPLKSIQMLRACGSHSRRRLCPANRLARLLARRYVVFVLSLLTNVGTKRFVDLRTRLKGMSASTLAAVLRDLSEMGIVTRTVSPERPPRVGLHGLGRRTETRTSPAETTAESHVIRVLRRPRVLGAWIQCRC